MTRSHRSSLLTLRPRTAPNSRPDDAQVESQTGLAMKRTASQTFSPVSSYPGDMRGPDGSLDAVLEGSSVVAYSQSTYLPPSSSLSRAGQSVKSSCKHICRRLSTSARRSSVGGVAAQSGHVGDNTRPSASQRPKLNSRHQEDSALEDTPTLDGPSGEYARYNPSPAPIPAQYPQYHPLETVALPPPGHAARAAAAAANYERLHRQQHQGEVSPSSFWSYLDSIASYGSPMDEVLKDNESGVGMSCTELVEEEDEELEKKFDPASVLPAEIMTVVLSYLDAPSLIRAECVSRTWHETASSNHVWKHVFLRRFKPDVPISPPPIMMGGAGIGKEMNGKPAPGQDWKRMYQVRMTIDRRWKGCSPSAIYLNGHTDSVYCCQFDENKVITGSRDRTIRVWDLKTYRCTKVIGGPTHRPVASESQELKTHPETVVSNPSLNGTPEGNAIFYMPSDYHDQSILCLQFDDTLMVTGSSDHTCIVWDMTSPNQNYQPLTRLQGHQAGVLDVALDSQHIISCSKDATIMVWDRKTFKHIRTLTGHRGPVNAVQLRGNLLVSASGDGVAKLWNLSTGACIKEFPSQDRGLAAVEFSSDAKYVLAGGNDRVVYKFDAHTGNLLHTSVEHGSLVRSLFLDAKNGRVVSGSYDQSIRVADFASGEVYGVYEDWTTSWILSAKSDYRRVVATSQDGRALILDFGWRVEGKELLER
ncbi:WD40 repeat-like protein [Sporormia fimetaria CBS 119925]|uniref:WD40 repeat-like protein n=1 Tax=Sporormia fimetaria CBS 119925 TaxID=1340428 RepID=A0A6A6V4H7_9PLEO|nr:WD40 repeat-like protein [Sporormia fimetaria CBS 119925]